MIKKLIGSTGGATVGGALGAVIVTGAGFAVLGPIGGAIGFGVGLIAGGTAGAVVGAKCANAIEAAENNQPLHSKETKKLTSKVNNNIPSEGA